MLPVERPLVIGHRGAPGYLPEHSMESYRLAFRQGADAVETDVVMSKDGVLVVRHENELSRTTDVATRPEFADRRATRVIGKKGAGTKNVTGWFTEDFTLDELTSLGAPTEQHRIITLDQLLLLVADESARAGRRLGLHVEVKHPAYFAGLGLPMLHPLLETLRDHGVEHPGSRVWIQSFDPEFVRRLDPLTTLPLVQLLNPSMEPVDCADIATYADAIGPKKNMVRKKGAPPTALVSEAHAAGLQVFAYTLRKGVQQARNFFDAGVDGVFTDYPDRCVEALAGLAVEETA